MKTRFKTMRRHRIEKQFYNRRFSWAAHKFLDTRSKRQGALCMEQSIKRGVHGSNLDKGFLDMLYNFSAVINHKLFPLFKNLEAR